MTAKRQPGSDPSVPWSGLAKAFELGTAASDDGSDSPQGSVPSGAWCPSSLGGSPRFRVWGARVVGDRCEPRPVIARTGYSGLRRISVAIGRVLSMFRSMEWQRYTALGIVAMTAALFVWRRFRSRRSGGWRSASASFLGSAHDGCGCTIGSGGAPPPSVIYRARKGERLRVETRPGRGGGAAG